MTRWIGPAYRVNDPALYTGTVADIIRYEQDVLGNQLGVDNKKLRWLSRLSYKSAVWVCKSKEDAQRYLAEDQNDDEIILWDVGENPLIVCQDQEGGFLVVDIAGKEKDYDG